MTLSQPTPYERTVLREIHKWRRVEPGLMGKLGETVSHKINWVAERMRKLPGIGWTMDKVDHAATGIMECINEIAQYSLQRETICNEYRDAGHRVDTLEDIRSLDLEVVNRIRSWSNGKYLSAAGSMGAATSFAGPIGIPADVLGIVGLSLRAVGEYASYYGYDMRLQNERWYAMRVLYEASGPIASDEQGTALVSARSATRSVAQQKTVDMVRQVVTDVTMQKMIRVLGTRLAKARAAKIVPVVGAVIGGALNVWYTKQVCAAALHMYRERRLLDKYPLDVILREYECCSLDC